MGNWQLLTVNRQPSTVNSQQSDDFGLGCNKETCSGKLSNRGLKLWNLHLKTWKQF
ncbi:MAG: hypothetical protein KME64_41820 [Scytonematopsis contorta HA4267-MV1]|nr:hypothetical protein [Scytonematopsis contorta HA4267-MV1]